MTEVWLTPHQGLMIPADEASADVIAELGPGQYRAKLSKPRNVAFNRKFFALLHVAFEAWEPNHLGEHVRASRERFRKDLLILAGYYESFAGIDGSIHLEPKSISFAAMDETEFQQLYNACVNVLLDRVMTTHSPEDIERAVNDILAFA